MNSMPKTTTPAQKTATLAGQVHAVDDWLRAQEPELAHALAGGLDAAYFARIVLTACRYSPKLLALASSPGRSRDSFALAVMHSAALGLEPNTPLGLAYLVPHADLVSLQIGYKGYVQLAWRAPRPIALTARVVREKDDYEYVEALPRPRFHHAARPPSEGGEMIAAYAIARTTGAAPLLAWVWRETIEAHRAQSPAYQRFCKGDVAETPWVTHPEPMWCKTAVKVQAYSLPLSPQFARALSIDDRPLEPESLPAIAPRHPLDALAEALRDEPTLTPAETGAHDGSE